MAQKYWLCWPDACLEVFRTAGFLQKRVSRNRIRARSGFCEQTIFIRQGALSILNTDTAKKTKKPLNSIAYDYVREKIMNHEFYAGMPLVESALAEPLGISRTPVREALKRLEEEGLVYSIPDRGTFVAHFTMRDVAEIIELRTLFETAALKSCIESVTDDDIRECREIIGSISENDDLQELRKKEQSLHDLIIKYCKNKRLLEFLELVKLQQERLRWMALLTPRRINRFKKGHMELLDLIEKRDYKKTARALTKHLSFFNSFISTNFDFPDV